MTDDITALDLDAIEARTKKATPGPWHECDDPWNGKPLIYSGERDRMFEGSVIRLSTPDYGSEPGYECMKEDINFIIAARTDIPALIAYARELEAEVRRLRAIEERAKDITASAGTYSGNIEPGALWSIETARYILNG